MRETTARPPLPPAPSPLGAARDRVLRTVADLETRGPVTIDAVTAAIGGHPNASRRLLDALADDGLLAVGVLRGGRGRPRRTYALTASGHAGLGTEASEHRVLIAAFAAHVGRQSPDAAETIGRLWGRARATSGLQSLDHLLARLGFDPAADEGGRIVLRTCPLLDIADDPDFMCRLHAGFLDGVGGEWGCRVRLEPFADPEGCLVLPD